MSHIPYRTYLTEEQMPKYWYNLRADMKEQHDPLINPATMQPVTVEDLRPVFCDELAKQELNSTDRYIPIPEEIQEFYKALPSLSPDPRLQFGKGAGHAGQNLL